MVLLFCEPAESSLPTSCLHFQILKSAITVVFAFACTYNSSHVPISGIVMHHIVHYAFVSYGHWYFISCFASPVTNEKNFLLFQPCSILLILITILEQVINLFSCNTST